MDTQQLIQFGNSSMRMERNCEIMFVRNKRWQRRKQTEAIMLHEKDMLRIRRYVARIYVDTPVFTGEVQSLCLPEIEMQHEKVGKTAEEEL